MEHRCQLSELVRAVITVGDGRGFVVAAKDGDHRLILTAAHCLPHLPPAQRWSYTEERTYPTLLAPLKSSPTVSAECLFVDPIADIAVLGSPDEQVLSDEAHAYEALVDGVEPFIVGDAREQLFETYVLGGDLGTVQKPVHSLGDVMVLSRDGEWVAAKVLRFMDILTFEDANPAIKLKDIVKPGMSGSPIVAPDGRAIGLLSSGSRDPILTEALPSRIGVAR